MFRTYDYQCKKCEEVFEAMTQVDEKAKCACGSTDLKRFMGAPLFKLKGNGWPGKEFKAQSDCKRMANGQTI
mgnify:FL=1|jgi:putative FmdB family regulatory protein|tara:strand:+ start:1134 stop:1349 length:216 start_codon:yes stop_codon:yes gene_type:complete